MTDLYTLFDIFNSVGMDARLELSNTKSAEASVA